MYFDYLKLVSAKLNAVTGLRRPTCINYSWWLFTLIYDVAYFIFYNKFGEPLTMFYTFKYFKI